MPANSIQKRIAVALETGTLAAPATINWDAIVSPGGLMATTSVDDAAIKRAYIADETITPRAMDDRAMLRGLRSGASATFSPYMAGHTSGHAATDTQATQDLMDLILRSGLGGQLLGYSATMTGGTAAEPEVTAGEGDNIEPYSWGYFVDASTGQGHFRQIESATTDTLTMVAGHELPFTPANADRMYAVTVSYVDSDVAEDYSNAGNDVLQVLMAGRQADDMFLLYGAKPEIQLGPITAGEPTKLTVPMHAVYFEAGDSLVITPALNQALQGSPGPIVGAGSTTRCWIAEPGDTLAAQQFWGSINTTLGITPERVMGPNGVEGVHGFGLSGDSYKAGALDVTVPFDSDWRVAAEAGTEYHFLAQIGNAITGGPWALYCPNLSFADDTEVGADGNSRRQQTLKFKMREAQIDVSALTATEAHRARAKFMILRVA